MIAPCVYVSALTEVSRVSPAVREAIYFNASFKARIRLHAQTVKTRIIAIYNCLGPPLLLPASLLM